MQKAFLAAAICQCCVALSVQAMRLNMTRIGEGAITPNVGVYSYSLGKKVTITATPADGWVVDHWEGDITGTGPSKTLYTCSGFCVGAGASCAGGKGANAAAGSGVSTCGAGAAAGSGAGFRASTRGTPVGGATNLHVASAIAASTTLLMSFARMLMILLRYLIRSSFAAQSDRR